MTDHERKMAKLSELKAMRLSPTDAFSVQLLLSMQEFFRNIDTSEVNAPFEEWSLTDMCRVLKVKVPS